VAWVDFMAAEAMAAEVGGTGSAAPFNANFMDQREESIMHTKTYISCRLIVAATVALLFAGGVAAFAQAQPQTFTSPSQAAQALYQAVKSSNQAALGSILGPEFASPDRGTEEPANRERFVQKYDQMHRFVREPDGTTILYVGAENWPFPVPLVEQNGQWRFDSDLGSQEVLAREIGRNETTAIQVCFAFAKNDSIGANHGAIYEFAAALRNGDNTNADGSEFGGYHFKVVDDKGAGVRLVAYPAKYRKSGIVTFIVTTDGSIYQHNLGVQTTDLAPQVREKTGGDWIQVQ
jgi:hypothetical protein